MYPVGDAVCQLGERLRFDLFVIANQQHQGFSIVVLGEY